jgi:hypothetical protein
MKSYIYSGPLSGVSLKEFGDVMLVPGATVQLPDGHGYTERLIRKGWLKEVLAEPVAAEQEIQPTTDNDAEQVTEKKRRK